MEASRGFLVTLAIVAGALAMLAFGAGAASASHVHCGDTITQDTTLDSDLTCAAGRFSFGPALEIGTDNITLDLNGHIIDSTAITAVSTGHSGVTIEGGTVKHSYSGIDLGGSQNRVRGMVLTANGAGLIGGGDSRIERNSVFANGVGMVLRSSSTVIRNTVFNNGTGVFLLGARNARIEKNSALRNLSWGFMAASPATPEAEGEAGANVFEHNVANDNGRDGFLVGPTDTVARNRANGNGDLGIRAAPGTIDGGHNRAFGNGNPLQCLNLVCK
jgi:parallel beta-helix repeat protein